jgi:hypothetical protein
MTDLNTRPQSELRLFLSVDISGSTALKNRKNHTGLLEEYENRKMVLKTFAEKGLITEPTVDLDDSVQCVQGILHDYSSEDFDWAAILERRFRDFNSAFATELVKRNYEDIGGNIDYFLWKALGDELIYSFKISARKQLHNLVLSFLRVIRSFDREDVSKKLIRLKGSGWVAGFPVRNRIVKFPGPQLYRRGEDGTCSVEHLYPRTDYLGPDIDTGFRVGTCGYPGFMVISMELAELLGEAPGELQQVRGGVVGWKKLKGVWNEIPYPIIWITLPEGLEIKYEQFDPWSGPENKFVAGWRKKKMGAIGGASEIFIECRAKLPPELGVVKPYLVDQLTDDAPIPESHRRILHLLDSLNLGIGGPQGEEAESPAETGRTKQEVEEDMQESLPEK